MSPTTITVGADDFNFNVTNKDVNNYMNNVSEKDKILPSVNLLLKTVQDDQKDALKKLIMDEDNTPKGIIVLNITGLLVGEFGMNTEISIKK